MPAPFRFPPTLLPFLMVVLMALLVVSCGDSSSASKDDEARDASGATTTSDNPDPSTPEAAEERTGATSFALTPAITACLAKAGFTTDSAPPAGGIIAFSHPDGARVVVAVSSETTPQVANAIGTKAAPASVDDTTVTTGPPALVDAATSCLS